MPYRHRPVQPTYFAWGSGWSTWLVEDQRFVDGRPDVLSWETAPLEQDLSVAGKIEAHLFASTTGTDSDWIVKLIDVYPEKTPADWKLAGRQLMVANDVFRGRYRKSFERPEPVPPNEAIAYVIDLHTQNYCFRKGHRLMVQVQSTWFPIIDRNPQTFVPNIFEAKPEDFPGGHPARLSFGEAAVACRGAGGQPIAEIMRSRNQFSLWLIRSKACQTTQSTVAIF